MTRFMAIKLHYDHRLSLPTELKYTKAVTKYEHDEYLRLFENGIGGQGFHECLNYFIPENGPARIYLPPTCIPREDMINDEFVIFSITYTGDQEMPSRIVGVHGNARLLNRGGLVRPDPNEVDLYYHAESDADFVALFTLPLKYNPKDGRYTPPYQRWGFGLRYIEKNHVNNIIMDQIRAVENELPSASDESRRAIMEREVAVLTRIHDRYIGGAIGRTSLTNTKNPNNAARVFSGIPDKELGVLGEQHIYDREIKLALQLGQLKTKVKWVSRGYPQSKFDIQTIRKIDGKILDHYIEVKSTTVLDDTHIFMSARELEFLESCKENCSLVLVRFNSDKTVRDVRELTISQARERFDFVPISYKLRPII